jgi:hypothetical protein
MPACEGVAVSIARLLGKYPVRWLLLGLFLVGPASPLFGTTAWAAPQTLVTLEYEVDPDVNGCPGAAEFRSAVERQLGYDPFRPAADRRVAVQIGRKGASFDGRIKWSDDRGRWVGDRRLASRRQGCADIAASLAFSVAVQIQLIATLAPSAPEPPSPVPAPVGPPTPAPVSDQPPVSLPQILPQASVAAALPKPEPRSAENARRLKLFLGFGPSLALWLAPHPTGLGRIFATGQVSWISVEIALDAALPATQREADGSGFSLDRFAAGAAVCGHASVLAACFTTTVGLLRARGLEVDAPASSSGLFSQLGARVGAAKNLGRRYFVAARADALVMLSSWTVRLNETAVWTTPRVGAVVGFDLGVRFF